MSDSQAKKNINVSRELKRRIKKAIVNHNIDNMQEGYVFMITKGLETMEKKKEAKGNG